MSSEKQRLGQGGYGSVYINKGGKTVSKYQYLSRKNKPGNNRAEYTALKRATYKGISSVPKLIGKPKKKPYTLASKRGMPAPKKLENYETNKATGYPVVSKLQMELVKGKPLRKYYNGNPLPKALGAAVKNAIQEIHSAGIIHGDLHADNIIIVEPGPNSYKAYIIDFGKSIIRTSKQGGGFKNANNANSYIKYLATRNNGTLNYVNHWTGKRSYRVRKNRGGNGRTHFLNGNFIRRMIIANK